MSRIDLVLEKMAKYGMDHLIVSDPSSIDYLIGYRNHPGERMFALLLSLDGNHHLFMNKLFYLDQSLDIDIVWYDDTQDGASIICDYLKDANCVGVDKNWEARFLMTVMKHGYDECTFEIGSKCVDEVRMVKDAKEQELMRQASLYNDEVIKEVVDLCAQGIYSENEIAQKLPDIYRQHHCSHLSFSPIIGYGKNGADGHHSCDGTKLLPGDSIVIDIGGVYQGYCSDMTRTVFYKEASKKQREVYELVKKANETAEAMIKPGVRLCDIDKAARDVIAQAGYGDCFNHRLGHFIGKDVHEYGDVSCSFDQKVEAGMIFSIEPGIYIKGEFGVRIEDLVLVTETGCEVLNQFPKDLMIIG